VDTPKPAITTAVSTDSGPSKPAISEAVSTDAAVLAPTRPPSASACESYRDLIAEALSRGRNAVAIWQDLVDVTTAFPHGMPVSAASW
jgi:hypothetical protein